MAMRTKVSGKVRALGPYSLRPPMSPASQMLSWFDDDSSNCSGFKPWPTYSDSYGVSTPTMSPLLSSQSGVRSVYSSSSYTDHHQPRNSLPQVSSEKMESCSADLCNAAEPPKSGPSLVTTADPFDISTPTIHPPLSNLSGVRQMSTSCMDHQETTDSSSMNFEDMENLQIEVLAIGTVLEPSTSGPYPATKDLLLMPTPIVCPLLPNQSEDEPISTDDTNHHQPMARHPYSLPDCVPTSASSVECCGIVPEIQNVVSTFNVHCNLDLKSIVKKAQNVTFHPKRFNAVTMRIKHPRTTAQIFSTGSVVCVGAKSLEYSRLAARKFARIIQKVGYPQATFSNFKIQNLVGSANVNFTIRLGAFSQHHYKHCMYEPEIFPGLKYRMIKPDVVVLIFSSGKVVITGAKEPSQITEAFENVYTSLLCFKKC